MAPLMRAPPAGPGLPAGSQPGGTRYMTGTTTTARHRPAAGDMHRQPMPPAFRRERRRPPRPLAASPHCSCPRRSLSPPRARPRPEPAGQHPLPTRFLDRSSRTSPRCGFSRVHAQAPRQALSAPLSAPLPRGRGHCLAERDPGLAWLASTSPEPATGRICVVTGNRAQPVTECVVCSQSPVTV